MFVQGSTSALINSINIPQISTGASCVDYSTSSPRVLCFGGIIDSINTNSINQVDLASNSLDALATWSILGTSGFPPSPRSNSIFIRLGNTLIVWGGIFNGVSTSDSLFYTFDLTSNTWQAPIAAKINQTVSNINIPAIVGGTVGGLILLILVILCLYYKRNRDRKQSVVKEDRKRYDLFIKNNPASEFYNQLRQSLSRKRNSTNSDGFISQLRRTLSRSKDKEVEEGESKRYSIYGLLGMSNKDGIPDVPNKRISVMSSTKSIVTNADLESHISAEKVQYKHHKETKTVEMVYPSTIDYHKSFSFPISKSLDRSLEPAIANENANLEDMEKSPASRLDDSKLKKASTVPNSTTETSQPPSLNEINVSPESVSTEIEQVKPVSNIEKQNFVAIYKFEPIVNIDSFEIPLSVGDLVYIKEEYDDGWVYGVNLSQRNMAGIFY